MAYGDVYRLTERVGHASRSCLVMEILPFPLDWRAPASQSIVEAVVISGVVGYKGVDMHVGDHGPVSLRGPSIERVEAE